MKNEPSQNDDDLLFLDLTEYNDMQGFDNILDLTDQINGVHNYGYGDYYSEHSPHHNPYFEEYASYHEVHPELDHHFDHEHDVHPSDFHEHTIHHAEDYHNKTNDFGDFERAASTREFGEVMKHLPHHHVEPHFEYGHHEIHRELDHHYDHDHDIQPYEYHEHSVKPAFDYA